MPLSYQTIAGPIIEPVTLAQAKQHLRVDFPDDDVYISALITAARQMVEKLMQRAIFNRKMLLTLDYFPWPGWDTTTGSTAHDYFMHWYYRGLTIRIPMPATQSVEQISYIANDGVTEVIIDPSKYIVDLTSEPARIAPTPGYTWPYQQNYIPGQVRVLFTAGTYVKKVVSEGFQVPTSGPTAYALRFPVVTEIVSVNDSDGNVVIPTVSVDPDTRITTLTFPAASAGNLLNVTYYYGEAPNTVVWAMLLLIGHLYANREASSPDKLAEIPLGVKELLAGESFDTLNW